MTQPETPIDTAATHLESPLWGPTCRLSAVLSIHRSKHEAGISFRAMQKGKKKQEDEDKRKQESGKLKCVSSDIIKKKSCDATLTVSPSTRLMHINSLFKQ